MQSTYSSPDLLVYYGLPSILPNFPCLYADSILAKILSKPLNHKSNSLMTSSTGSPNTR